MSHATRTVLRFLQQATSCSALRATSCSALRAPGAAGLSCRLASAVSCPSRQQSLPSARRGPQQMADVSEAVLRQEAKRTKSMTEAASGAAAQQQSATVAEVPRQQRRSEDAENPHRQLPTMQEVEQQLGPFSAAATLAEEAAVVLVISGPSGVGKDAVIARLRERRPELHFVVTATTRAMRAGEVHGRDYFFVSRAQFEAWLAEGNQLLEHALVYGDYKGIPRQQVEEALANRTDVVLRIDVQGAATVRAMMPDTLSIFLAAGSEAELVQRLVSRKTEDMETILARVTTARSEAARMPEFDYVVVNEEGRLDDTVREIEGILRAEKSRVARRLPHPHGA